MAESASAAPAGESVVLKIMTGVQAGVDVRLTAGEYTLGSGPDDDIQIYDVSLKPAHAKLRVAGGKVDIAGGSGELRSAAGLDLAAGGDFTALEPLDVVSAGTTRFATGLASANWASITEDAAAAPRAEVRRPPSGVAAGSRRLSLALSAAAALVVLSGGLWFLLSPPGTVGAVAQADTRPRLDRVREALAQFSFAKGIKVAQEVDGEILVSGYVEEPVERRAILGAVRDADEAARVRLVALSSTREEIANLLSSRHETVGFELDGAGAVTLTGVVLDPVAADATVGLVRDRVAGLSSVTSKIRTAPSLLADVQGLADRSRIRPLVIFRLDGNLIEASGVLPVEKIDPWVGFLQAYSTQFADMIPLRSLVSLQNADGSLGAPGEVPADRALVLGKASVGPNEVAVDPRRLSDGRYELGDIFTNAPTSKPGEASAPVAAADTATASGIDLSGLDASSRPVSAAPLVLPAVAPARLMDAGSSTLAGSETEGSVPEAAAARTVRTLIDRWIDGTLPPGVAGAEMRRALDRLNGNADGLSLKTRYAPLAAANPAEAEANCWPGARVTPVNLKSLVFWLDVLSVNDKLSLTGLDPALRGPVLEAALNPKRLSACAARAGGEPLNSAYLDEVARNPGFANFIARDLKPYQLDIAGADLTGERYIQMRNGDKLHQGAAPDRNSRLASVGDIGVAIEGEGSLSAVVYGAGVNWYVR